VTDRPIRVRVTFRDGWSMVVTVDAESAEDYVRGLRARPDVAAVVAT